MEEADAIKLSALKVRPTDAPTDTPTDTPTDLSTDARTDSSTDVPSDALTDPPQAKRVTKMKLAKLTEMVESSDVSTESKAKLMAVLKSRSARASLSALCHRLPPTTTN
jgi:hypothetical protein